MSAPQTARERAEEALRECITLARAHSAESAITHLEAHFLAHGQAAERSAIERVTTWLENAEKDYNGNFVLDARSIIAWIRSLT